MLSVQLPDGSVNNTNQRTIDYKSAEAVVIMGEAALWDGSRMAVMTAVNLQEARQFGCHIVQPHGRRLDSDRKWQADVPDARTSILFMSNDLECGSETNSGAYPTREYG
jgi:hypothetical protein